MLPSSVPSLPEPAPPVLCLTGPTAVGKSDVALLLAERLRGEIVSVDSMQVYRGLDLGTAKATLEERARVPHHLIDVVDLSESFDVARFLRLAHEAVHQIRKRGRLPILCGGSGLYLKAFLHGLGEAPPAAPALRAELAARPLPDLVRELAERDPTAHARIDLRNPRRVIRALEILRLTTRPLSAQRADWSAAGSADAAAGRSAQLFALLRPTPDLHRRIEARVDRMFAQGLVPETRRLLDCGLQSNPTASQAVGYRQVIEHLRGERALEDTIVLVKQRTRHLAKRQLTWVRHQLTPTWLNWESDASPADIAAVVERSLQI